MMSRFTALVVSIIASALLIPGWSQNPPLAATPAPASSTKQVDFPRKGRVVSIIVGAPAGGSNDIGARVIAPLLEKELGTPVQVVNKPGAGQQVGITEAARSKPDGYTMVYANLVSVITSYLDPQRQAAYGRKELQPLAMHVVDPAAIAVKADGPFKDMKDFIAAAKANPDRIKLATYGIMSAGHLDILALERATGTKFAIVQFDGGGTAYPALMGGHVDAYSGGVSALVAQVNAGQFRVIGVMDKEESRFLPSGKTMLSQGIPLISSSARGMFLPAGTPKEILDILSDAIKRAMASAEHKGKMDEQALFINYMGPQEMDAYWTEYEKQLRPLVEVAKQKQ
jgi:tripartite-type tricarboxylate transporter receptor subunit TctC